MNTVKCGFCDRGLRSVDGGNATAVCFFCDESGHIPEGRVPEMRQLQMDRMLDDIDSLRDDVEGHLHSAEWKLEELQCLLDELKAFLED